MGVLTQSLLLQIRERSFSLVTSIPRWSTLAEETVKLYTNRPIRKLSELLRVKGVHRLLGVSQARPTNGTSETAVRVKRAPAPFATGGEAGGERR